MRAILPGAQAITGSIHAIATSERIEAWILRTAAVLTGVVIPLLVIGRGAASILLPVIGGLSSVLLVSSWARLRRRIWQGGALGWVIVAMLAVLLVSVAGSVKPAFSFTIWLQLAGLILLIAALPLLLAQNSRLFAWTLRILLAASLLGTVIAVVSIYLWPPLLGYVRPVDAPTAYHSALRLKSYGAVMPCLAPVLLWAGFRLGGAWRAVALAGIVLGGVIVYGANNRAALGGYAGAVGLVLLALVLRRSRAPLRLAVLAVLIAGLAAIGAWVSANLPPMPFDGTQQMRLPTWVVDTHRQIIWGFVLDRALERPWFGWGLSAANFMPGANDPIPVIGQVFVPLHPHNWVLQIFCEAGIVGLLFVAAVILLFLRKLVALAPAGKGAGWAALAVAGAFFVSDLANFSIWQGWWQAVLVILISISLTGTRVDCAPGASDAIEPEKRSSEAAPAPFVA